MKVFISASVSKKDLKEEYLKPIDSYAEEGAEFIFVSKVEENDLPLPDLSESGIEFIFGADGETEAFIRQYIEDKYDNRVTESEPFNIRNEMFLEPIAFSKKTDAAVFLWDQKDPYTLFSILTFLQGGKPVFVNSVKIDTIGELCRLFLEDDKNYIPYDDCLPFDLFERIVNECVPSDVIRAELLSEPLPKLDVSHYGSASDTVLLINNAPITINRKAKLFTEVSKTDNLCLDVIHAAENDLSVRELSDVIYQSFTEYARAYSRALAMFDLDEDEFYSIRNIPENAALLSMNYERGTVFFTQDALLKELDQAAGYAVYQSVTKCRKNRDGGSEEIIEYFTLGNKIIDFAFLNKRRNRTARGGKVVFPTPFKAGDIVASESIPYSREVTGVVLAAENPKDAGYMLCGTDILCRSKETNGDVRWQIITLDSAIGGYCGTPLSYRVRYAADKPGGKDAFLNVIADFVKDNSERGYNLCYNEELWGDYPEGWVSLSTDKLEEYIESQGYPSEKIREIMGDYDPVIAEYSAPAKLRFSDLSQRWEHPSEYTKILKCVSKDGIIWILLRDVLSSECAIAGWSENGFIVHFTLCETCVDILPHDDFIYSLHIVWNDNKPSLKVHRDYIGSGIGVPLFMRYDPYVGEGNEKRKEIGEARFIVKDGDVFIKIGDKDYPLPDMRISID